MVSAINSDCKEEEVIGHLNKEQLATFEEYCNNVTNIDPKEKNAFIIGVAVTILDSDLSLESLQKEPRCHGKFLKPSRKLLQKELKQRGGKTKGILNLTISALIEKISEKTTIVEEDKMYCFAELKKLKAFVFKSRTNPEKKDKSVHMSLNDCLRFVHCLFSDEVRPLYEESQAVLSREELDARNSTDKKQTYKDALTLKFNEQKLFLTRWN